MTTDRTHYSAIVIGAGIAGIMAARRLHDAGVRTIVLDKGRNFGGRMATWQINHSRLDHGAQSIVLDQPKAADIFKPLVDSDTLKPWYGDFAATHYLATDGMSAAVKQLAVGLEVHLATRVTHLDLAAHQWTIHCDDNRHFNADMLILTPPAPQTLTLLQDSDIPVNEDTIARLRTVSYDKCLTLMALFDNPLKLTQSGWLRTDNQAVSWITDNAVKGLSSTPAIVIQAAPAFSEQHFDQPDQLITDMMLSSLAPLTSGDPTIVKLHRWRYSQAVVKDPAPYLMTTTPAPLAIAGDCFAGRQITGAALSGLRAAESLLQHLDIIHS